MTGAAETPLRAIRAARAAGARLQDRAPWRSCGRRGTPPSVHPERPSPDAETNTPSASSRARKARSASARARLLRCGSAAALRAQEERIGLEHERAQVRGERRRALTLEHRRGRVREQIAHAEQALGGAREAPKLRGLAGVSRGRERELAAHAAFLNEQVGLPGMRASNVSRERATTRRSPASSGSAATSSLAWTPADGGARA